MIIIYSTRFVFSCTLNIAYTFKMKNKIKRVQLNTLKEIIKINTSYRFVNSYFVYTLELCDKLN